jgi:hypothetical protein
VGGSTTPATSRCSWDHSKIGAPYDNYYRARIDEALQPISYVPTTIDFYDPYHLYNVSIEPATTQNTLVIRQSNDAGAHWQQTTHTFATQVYDYLIPTATSNEIYVLTRGTHQVQGSRTLINDVQLWRSTDAGMHWTNKKTLC